MTPAEFEALASLMHRRTGVILPAAKSGLAEANLWEVRRQHGLPPIGDILHRATSGDRALEAEIIEAMLTSETLFFRDVRPFEDFSRLMLPHFQKARAPGETIRIWSAASASGQEAYSLAMQVVENRTKLGGRQVEILGTDISQSMVARARQGRYSSFEVQRGLSSMRLITHFTREGTDWIIKPEIAALARFEQLNLMADFSHLPLFDIIFCRNVMLYFDDPTRTRLLAGLESRLRPDGFLVIGGAESLLGLNSAFVPAGADTVSYVRPGQHQASATRLSA